MWSRIWSSYMSLLQKRPIVANTITMSTVTVVGDVVAQAIEQRMEYSSIIQSTLTNTDTSTSTSPSPSPSFSFHLDRERSLRMFVWGCMTGAPIWGWYRLLDRVFVSRTFPTIVSKIAVNQSTMAVFLNVSFYGYIVAWENGLKTREDRQRFLIDWRAKLDRDLLHTTQKSFTIWGCAHLFNFYYVPTHARVLFQSFFGVFWTAYLSMVGHAHHDESIGSVTLSHDTVPTVPPA